MEGELGCMEKIVFLQNQMAASQEPVSLAVFVLRGICLPGGAGGVGQLVSLERPLLPPQPLSAAARVRFLRCQIKSFCLAENPIIDAALDIKLNLHSTCLQRT